MNTSDCSRMRLIALSPGIDGTFYFRGLRKNSHLHFKAAWGPRNVMLELTQIGRKIRETPYSHFTAFFFFFPFPDSWDFAESAPENACSSPTPHLINWKLTFSLTHRWGSLAHIFQHVYNSHGPSRARIKN